MKHLLLTTIAAVVLVGCGKSQQSAPAPETPTVELVAEAAPPEPPAAKAPAISIHDAVEKGNIEVVKQHLATGTDVNAKVEGGGTALHEAALNGHKEVVELLITAGADVNAKIGKGGPTPLNFVNSRIQPETFALLRKHGGKTRAELKAEGK